MSNDRDKHNVSEMPAYNWRFGASGGVAPRKVKWENERLCPA